MPSPEQQAEHIREQAAACGMTVEQWVATYNNLTPEQIKAAMRARELRGLDVAVAEATEPKSSLPCCPDIAEDLTLAGSPVFSPMKMWYVRCVYGKPDEWAPIMFSVFADAALAAYEVMRKRGWKLQANNIADKWEALLAMDHMSRHRIGHGDTFAEALSRAIVATAKQEAH